MQWTERTRVSRAAGMSVLELEAAPSGWTRVRSYGCPGWRLRSHWPSAILPHPTVLAVQPLEAYPHVSPTTTSGLALTLGGRPPPIVKPTSFLRALYRSLNESLTSTLAVSRSDLAGFESTDANDISVSRSSTARSEWRFLVLLC